MAAPQVTMEQHLPAADMGSNEAAQHITEILRSAHPDISKSIRVQHASRPSAPSKPSRALALPPSQRARVTYSIAAPPASWLTKGGALARDPHALVFDELSCAAVALDAQHPEVWRSLAGSKGFLNVAYVRPLTGGEDLLLTAEVVYVGRSRATVWGELRTADGALIALYENNKSSRSAASL